MELGARDICKKCNRPIEFIGGTSGPKWRHVYGDYRHMAAPIHDGEIAALREQLEAMTEYFKAATARADDLEAKLAEANSRYGKLASQYRRVSNAARVLTAKLDLVGLAIENAKIDALSHDLAAVVADPSLFRDTGVLNQRILNMVRERIVAPIVKAINEADAERKAWLFGDPRKQEERLGEVAAAAGRRAAQDAGEHTRKIAEKLAEEPAPGDAVGLDADGELLKIERRRIADEIGEPNDDHAAIVQAARDRIEARRAYQVDADAWRHASWTMASECARLQERVDVLNRDRDGLRASLEKANADRDRLLRLVEDSSGE